MSDAARAITLVAAQTEADAARIRLARRAESRRHRQHQVRRGAAEAALRDRRHAARAPRRRPVLLCASTREGEEALILDAFKRAGRTGRPACCCCWCRAIRSASTKSRAWCEARGLSLARRSDLPQRVDADVLLGDSMGEMFAYYAACDCAFIGGSLLPLGGQNLIEACALGKPVLVGEHTFNFLDATEEAVASRRRLRVPDADALLRAGRACCSMTRRAPRWVHARWPSRPPPRRDRAHC
jgi:3-deoxy-D-manno-octulosonic-acid transferase